MRWLRTRWCQSPSAARGEPLREEDVILELIVPRCLPVAPRPVAGELLSSWIERIAAANAITGAELLKSVTDCLSMERQHALLDYCLAPTLRCALAIACRVSDLDVQTLELGNQFRNLQPEWVLPGAKVVLIPVAKPGICTECIAEQHIAGVPMHLRAEWALAFLTHCPKTLSVAEYQLSDLLLQRIVRFHSSRIQPALRQVRTSHSTSFFHWGLQGFDRGGCFAAVTDATHYKRTSP